MRYRPSPFNIVGAGLLILAIYFAIFPGPMGAGLWVTAFTIPTVIVGSIIDLVLQKKVHPFRRVVIIELLLLGLIISSYLYQQRAKTYILPDQPSFEHLVVVYGVEDAEPLPVRFWPTGYHMEVPQDGIIFTSTPQRKDLQNTKMFFQSGISLQNHKDEFDWAFTSISNRDLQLAERRYGFNAWKIGRVSGINYSGEELEALEERVKERLGEGETE